MSSRTRARRRGRALEYRVANVLGGIVWPGQDGDVEARGYRIECKSRSGWRLKSTTELADFIDQIRRYQKEWPEGKRWALAIHGGGKSPTLICIPIEDFARLTQEVEESPTLLSLVQQNLHVFQRLIDIARGDQEEVQ